MEKRGNVEPIMHMVRRSGSTTRTISRAALIGFGSTSMAGTWWSESRRIAANARDSVRFPLCLVFPYARGFSVSPQNGAFS